MILFPETSVTKQCKIIFIKNAPPYQGGVPEGRGGSRPLLQALSQFWNLILKPPSRAAPIRQPQHTKHLLILHPSHVPPYQREGARAKADPSIRARPEGQLTLPAAQRAARESCVPGNASLPNCSATSSKPVFNAQALHALKFLGIICHHNQISTQPMSGDQSV